MHSEFVLSAQTVAHAAHDSIKQVRKYSGLPYWSHTDEVANIVAALPMSTDQMIAAAHLHDVIEDVFPKNPYYSIELIKREFGDVVAEFVTALTDVFTKENYSKLNRRNRKIMEAERLGKVGSCAQTIKLADLIANSRDIMSQDEGFARTYIQEKRALLCKLTKGDRNLWMKAARQCGEAYEKLGLTWD